MAGCSWPCCAILEALHHALRARGTVQGCIHRTDRDNRYASDDYLAALAHAGLVPSMSRKADCWDNAVAESFFATLEKELLADLPILPAEQTTQRVDAYIDRYYNVARRHSTIDFKSPIAYELETQAR